MRGTQQELDNFSGQLSLLHESRVKESYKEAWQKCQLVKDGELYLLIGVSSALGTALHEIGRRLPWLAVKFPWLFG